MVSEKAPTFSNLRRLQQSTILQTMFDPTSLLFGPTWLGFLASVAKVPGLSANEIPRLNLLEGAFKDVFLNQSEIRFMSCDQEVFDRLIILPNKRNSETQKVKSFFLVVRALITKILQKGIKVWNLVELFLGSDWIYFSREPLMTTTLFAYFSIFSCHNNQKDFFEIIYVPFERALKTFWILAKQRKNSTKFQTFKTFLKYFDEYFS